VIGGRSHKLRMRRERDEVRDHLVPGLRVLVGCHTYGILFIAIFIVDRLLREDVRDRNNCQRIVSQRAWIPGRMQAKQGNGSNLLNNLSFLSDLLRGGVVW